MNDRLGDHAAMHNMRQKVIQQVLDGPVEPGEFLQGRRSTRLTYSLGKLALLPAEVPFDRELVARAARAPTS